MRRPLLIFEDLVATPWLCNDKENTMESRIVNRTKPVYPKRLTEWEMSKVGVEILDLNHIQLRCGKCGHCWWPCIQPGGRLPRGYWRCENGCNDPNR